MSQRLAIVTGASGGIGRATSFKLRQDGWTTIGIDTSVEPKSAELDKYIQGDVSLERTWSKASEVIRAHGGRLHALINNAALQIVKPLVDTDPAEWEAVHKVNVLGCYLAVRALHETLHEGSVVNVSSVHALATSSGLAAYATSKGALVALTRALAIELAPQGTRVNAVLPGAIDTQMLRNGLAREQFKGDSDATRMRKLSDRTPLQRIGRPEDVAQAIVFLSDAECSGFITGQTLVVDGGVTAHLSSE